jgi:hypothetical protein
MINLKNIPQMILLQPHKVLIKITMKKKINTMIKFKRRARIKGGDEDDGDKGEAPPHPRVRHNVQRDHPVDNILSDIKKGITTRSCVTNFCEYYSFVSSFEPFKVEDALCDTD